MNGQLNGALKSSELDGHKDASVIRKRKPSSDQSAFGAVFSITARYDLFYTSPSSSNTSPFQPLHLSDPLPTPKLLTASAAPIPTVNIIGHVDGRMQPLHVLDIPSIFGDRMAPLNVSKMFESKIALPDVTRLLTRKLHLSDLPKDFGSNMSNHDTSELSRLSDRLSGSLCIPSTLCNAIVERLPCIVTKVLAEQLLPPNEPNPHTTPDDINKLCLKDIIPTANVSELLESSPAGFLTAGPTPKRFWHFITQSERLFGGSYIWSPLPWWLVVPLFPLCPLGGALCLGSKLFSLVAKSFRIVARILSTLTAIWKAYERLAHVIKLIHIVVEFWQVDTLNRWLSIILSQDQKLTMCCQATPLVRSHHGHSSMPIITFRLHR